MQLAELFDDLIRFETELWNVVDARLRNDADLPLSWFEPMRVMQRVPSCRVFDIASQLSITIGGTSKLVDRIEAAGLCRRLANPTDRRSSLIELTGPGRRLLAKATRSFDDELQQRIGSATSEARLRQFHATLTRLREASAAVDDSRSTA